MADDISKKITIQVNLEADEVTKNIKTINDAIDGLLSKQQQLSAAGQQNTAAFNDLSTALQDFQKKLQDVNTQVTTNTSSLNDLSKAAKGLGSSLSSTTAEHQKNAKAAGDNTAKTKTLSVEVSTLNKTVVQQKSSLEQSKVSLDNYGTKINKTTSATTQLKESVSQTSISLQQGAGAVTENKTAFDAHAATMEHLKSSFDEIKDVSGIFGPSLQEAAKGFNVMKSGLTLVQDGLKGVGTAIKADGFEFLLQVLQLIFDAFVHSSTGSKMLQGAISAIGVVINTVKEYFNLFVDGIVNAFLHPIDTLKSLGKTIEQNLINRFTAFGVILDGLIHLDFKKMANGAIQAFTGVTNATDKIGKAFTTVKNGVIETAGKMVEAYKEGYNQAGKHVEKHEKKVKSSLDRINKMHQESAKSIDCSCDEDVANSTDNDKRQSNLNEADKTGGVTDITSDTVNINAGTVNSTSGTANSEPGAGVSAVADETLKNAKDKEKEKVEIKKTAIQQVENYAKQSALKLEDYAKKNAGKIATDALNMLTNSIKQQAEAKIAALEKDKAAELKNSSLTSAQKLSIEEKYKKKEGAVRAKAFKEEQEISIAKAVINGAEAVTKVWAEGGLLGAVEAGVVIAETALQIKKIASQKTPAYASGGLHYSSDGLGGVLPGYSRTDNTNAYLRSGEGIVVSEAMQVPWARNLVSAVNVGFGGRDFSIINPGRGYAVGGIFTDGGDANRYYNQPVNDQKNLANTIAYQMINNFPPVYVDVKDVNNQQNILAQTINRVNL